MVNTEESIRLRCIVVILLRVDVSDNPSPDSGERAPSYAILRVSVFEGQPVKNQRFASPSYNGIRHI